MFETQINYIAYIITEHVIKIVSKWDNVDILQYYDQLSRQKVVMYNKIAFPPPHLSFIYVKG